MLESPAELVDGAAANVFGAAMLMMLQPFLLQLNGYAAERYFDMGTIITIGLIVAVFTLVMLFAMRMGAGIAGGFATSRGRSPGFDKASVDGAAVSASDRAEQMAARLALSDRTLASEPPARRARESASAVAELTPISQRIGQTYRRTPRTD